MKMKSSATCYARRVGGATFDGNESSIVAPSYSEANSVTCHCHCLSSSCGVFEKDDGVSSLPSTSVSLTTVCDLCERLRGQTSRRYDAVNATWTRDSHAADRSGSRRILDKDDLPNNLKAIVRKRDRTLRCEPNRRTPLRESSARSASSVVRWSFAARFHGGFKSTEWRWLLWIFFLILAVCNHVAADNTGPNGVCQSIDIRNNVSEFSKLKGCRIVEGFVQISLIDRAEPSDYANFSFPELVEITDFLLLYRVNGLKTLANLFPNLAVIRGNSLIMNYALMAFEMMHLQEIGLHSLTNILRGSVHFEKNPMLCFVDTIDWDIIAKAGNGEHFIKDNKPLNGCPLCEKKCPIRQTKPDQTLCWNLQHCQQICDRKCEDRACDSMGKCCHPFCLSGCTGPTANDCVVCRHVVINGKECKDHCPKGKYKFMNRRCIDESECRQMPKSMYKNDEMIKPHPYKPFNDSCVIECPAGYMESEDYNNHVSCQKCEGRQCLKECPGAKVMSIESAQKLRGCTHLTGSLDIEIRGGKNIVKELEDNLGMIEEIDGSLKIVRSFPLISLNFLKNLRVIRGNDSENKYSISVLDNQNLQELWDWNKHPNMTILAKEGRPKVFFHFNPKLCLHEIEKLRVNAKLEEFSDHEVASNSNGDKIACNVTELETEVTWRTPVGAIIKWTAFKHHDIRSLLGYVVYFIEAPNQNVTMYDGRDACGGDGWRVEDVSADSTTLLANQTHNGTQTDLQEHLHILTQLKPYTQYAYYVKTYTIATERSGAQSKITYFTTKPDAPSSPRALSTWSNSSNELVISWFPPLKKNGNLTHYRIVGRWEPDDQNFIDQRNYCDEPMPLLETKSPEDVIAEQEKKHFDLEKEFAKTDSCVCSDREVTDQSMLEKEVSSSIAFENALHNQVYVKRAQSRRRRHIGEMLNATTELPRDSTYNQNWESINDKVENGTVLVFERIIPSTNLTFVMRNLRHFTAYNIEVQACRELDASELNDTKVIPKNCSMKSMKTYRTLSMTNADNIPPNSFTLIKSGENNSLATVTLFWDEPVQPNGLVVTYQIEYKRIDIENIKATVVCITRRDFVKNGNSYTLKELSAGNYSIKVRATSLAGNGEYTEVKYFFIEEYGTLGTFWIIFCSIIGVFITSVSLLTFYIIKKRSMRNVPSMRLIATVNPEYVSTSYVPDEWEVPRKKIQLLRELGNGSFGMVYEGLAKDVVKGKPEVRCAVKTVNENATDRERIEFLNEASVMKAFNTHHVVRLLGVVSQGQPTLVVMELMVNGDLKTYLRSHRPDVCENSKQPPTLRDILQMAVEIADGMSYLSAKKFVHRDLAARNCMVAEDLTVKIGDFGMTRDIYETDYYRKGSKGLLPVRWMAPESLKDGVFTSFSDVWSYGVVLWEMVTLASQPYQGLSNDQVLRYVIEGGVMERPENCPDSLYNLMRRTWNHRATRRPTFIDIETLLLQEVSIEGFENVSFYHSPEGIEARNQNNSHSPQNDQDLEMVALQDLREEEMEGEEDSPLRQDFGDFASFEPRSIKNNLSPQYGVDSYGETSKVTSNFHDMNSTKVPKAGFDEFGGISGDSLVSSKDTLNSPFVGSLKSVSSPFIYKKSTSRGNVSQGSLGKSASPQSSVKRNFLDSPNPSKLREDPDYENRSPEIISGIEKKDIISLHVEFPSVDVMDIQINGDKTENNKKHTGDYINKSETLNNGYIGSTTT
ncbi:insulin-like receptor [Monomorium pharaonis]|uniref:insulin-like receptor n=1 Tax=Monomorium pharaonis TaxID=307658 RepID=UPI00063F5939|nr:insulin-like receptor [Monomorium pharaonis]XP_036146604.1 insulin-like receptor [Monomorium pharaonis]XP_036146605.1 insulin-like receptor [Monomorium pharaonis]